VTRLSADAAAVTRWTTGRVWRWLLLLAIPGLVVTAYLIARAKGWIPAPPPAAFQMPGMPPNPAAAAAKPWYDWIWRWAHPKDWWVIALVCVPGVLPFVFVLLRAFVEVALRVAGTVLQTALLAVTQLLIGLLRMCGLLVAPVAGFGLLVGIERGNA
jgi:hypothetical protein